MWSHLTTYLTNKYDMSFAPFVGVNHHGQSILLGCGLLFAEDTPTFMWLFQCWRRCMLDKSPDGIITTSAEQCKMQLKLYSRIVFISDAYGI